MKQNINLMELEKKTWRSIFITGLVDIEIGLIFLVGSICMIFSDISYYLMPLYLVPLILFFLVNKFTIVPRMGIVKFSRRRRRKNAFLVAVITTSLIILIVLTVVAKTNIIPKGLASQLTVIAVILIICFSIAFFMNFTRMYFYAFLITASFILSDIIRSHPGIISKGGYAYLLSSAVMIIIGTIYLHRFLKKYPLSEKGGSTDK